MSMQRARLRIAFAAVSILCFGTGYASAQTDAKAQTGLAWEMKMTQARIRVLDNPRPRPKSDARLTTPPSVFVTNAAKSGKKATPRSVSDFAPENGMILSGGTQRLSGNAPGHRLSPSLQDTQAIIGRSSLYDSSWGAFGKKSSAPRRRLTSP